MRQRLLRPCFVICLVTVLSVAVLGQSERATVNGRVTDSTGAVVPDADVQVTNVGTDVSFNTKSNADGIYTTAATLKPGSYTVTVVKSGFKKATSDQIVVQISDVKEVDVALQIGSQQEQVTVTAQGAQLETETSNRGEVITGREITELPLKDRNFTDLATLTPGVTRALTGVLMDQTAFNQGDPNAGSVPGLGDARGSTESSRFSRSGGASLSANGLRPTNNDFTIDGVDNNEPQFGTIGVFPNPDAIAEFKVETSVAKAESGRGGAQVATAIQSGSNAFHGSAYYYGQNDALNATHPVILSQRAQLVAAGKTQTQADQLLPKSRIRVNEFGFTFGGPLVKNRTFFFGDYLGQRNKTPNNFSSTVPSDAIHDFLDGTVCNGDFSNFTHPIRDPLTQAAFPGNIVVGLCNRPDLSAQAVKLLDAYPRPNVKGVIDANSNNGVAFANYLGVRNNQERINSGEVKIDHRFSEKNNISGRYYRSNQERDRANFFPKVPTAGFGAGNEIGNTRQISVSDTHAFRPTLLNEVRFGWTHPEIGIFNCGVGGACGVSATFCKDIGIPNCNTGDLASSGGILTGGFGNGFFEFTGDGGLFLVKSDNFNVADSVTIVSGKHTWKAGVDLRPRHLHTIDGGRSGGLKGALNYGDSNTGNAQLDILLGNPDSSGIVHSPAPQASHGAIAGGDKLFELRTMEWSLFVQDDWKVSPSLTLNLGVRYDVFPNWTEASGRLANFNPATNQIVKATGSGDRLISTDYKNIGPRVGFAYNFGNTRQFVVRGGYGLFYTQDGVDYPPEIRDPPLTASVGFDAFAGNPGNFSLTTGPPPVTFQNPPVIQPQSTLFSQQIDQKVGTVHEWNLTWQWQAARDWALDVGYVGSRSRHLLATRNLGNANNGLGLVTTSNGCSGTPPCPVANITAYENRGSGNYDALQARLDKRFSHGLLGGLSYTWSHNIDDSAGVFGGAGDQRSNAFGPVNPLDFRVDRSNSSLDRRQVLSGNLIYDLPFGRGKAFAGSASGPANAVIGGWELNTVVTAGTGQPFTVSGDTGGGFDSTANLVGDPFANVPAGLYLNPAAFLAPASGNPGTTCVNNLSGKQVCYGDTRRNRFYGPHYFRTDVSFFKNFSVTERVTGRFGIQMFNTFNNDDKIVPQARITNSDFATFFNALPPRTMQYQLKILF